VTRSSTGRGPDGDGPWQPATLEALRAAVRSTAGPGVVVEVVGSAAEPAALDQLSDLDVMVTMPDRSGPDASVLLGVDWLGPVGEVWTFDRTTDAQGSTLRVVFVDGRRIDLRFPAAVVAPAAAGPDEPADPVGSVATVVAKAHFVAAVAAVKLGRRDLLIGAHLALEVVRNTLVLGMLLRDRDTGVSAHRHGSARDGESARVSVVLAALPADAGATDWLDLLAAVREPFDALAGELDPLHRSDWRGLDSLVHLARAALARADTAG